MGFKIYTAHHRASLSPLNTQNSKFKSTLRRYLHQVFARLHYLVNLNL